MDRFPHASASKQIYEHKHNVRRRAILEQLNHKKAKLSDVELCRIEIGRSIRNAYRLCKSIVVDVALSEEKAKPIINELISQKYKVEWYPPKLKIRWV